MYRIYIVWWLQLTGLSERKKGFLYVPFTEYVLEKSGKIQNDRHYHYIFYIDSHFRFWRPFSLLHALSSFTNIFQELVDKTSSALQLMVQIGPAGRSSQWLLHTLKRETYDENQRAVFIFVSGMNWVTIFSKITRKRVDRTRVMLNHSQFHQITL